MLPKQIEVAIAAGIAASEDLPVRPRGSDRREGVADSRVAVQQPEGHLPGRCVLPYEVRMAVVVEISDGSHPPQWIRNTGGIEQHATLEYLPIEHPHTQLSAVRLKEQFGLIQPF